MPRRSPVLPRLPLAAAVLTAVVLAAAAAAAPPPATAPAAAAASAQGLPPAPPPSGIRPSRRAAEREERLTPPPAGPLPRRATGRAFDEALVLEVRGLERPEADAALRAAAAELRELERLLAPEGDAEGGLAALNAAAGGEPVVLDARLLDLLSRALAFCTWSGQAHGPLGGGLYALWGLDTERGPGSGAAGRPTTGALRQASAAAACDRLRLDAASGQAQLATGSRVELWGFARGFLVDRAMDVLADHGAEDAFVELGWVRRAAGSRDDPASPEDRDRGWPVTLPVFPGWDRPFDRIWLRDEALAVASALHRPLLVGGDRYAPYLDQRSGAPAAGVTGVVTVTELAADAEALAAAMMIFGNRQGLLRAGGLQPAPAVLWLLGGGEGVPVQAQHNWSHIALR
jgi:FAD:protein FMN transferase